MPRFSLSVILVVLALICFILATFSTPVPYIQLEPLGLTLLVAGILAP